MSGMQQWLWDPHRVSQLKANRLKACVNLSIGVCPSPSSETELLREADVLV